MSSILKLVYTDLLHLIPDRLSIRIRFGRYLSELDRSRYALNALFSACKNPPTHFDHIY
jgi:hypothetical protein